jgi:hypothetical protein
MPPKLMRAELAVEDPNGTKDSKSNSISLSGIAEVAPNAESGTR